MNKKRVLFLCTRNSARSQMAEAILRRLAGHKYDVFSAGTHPKDVNPRTRDIMKEIDIDIGAQASKNVQQFLGEKFDYVIAVCGRAKMHCPLFSGSEPIHWGFDDPADAPPGKELQTFRRVRDEIVQRLRLFLLSNRD